MSQIVFVEKLSENQKAVAGLMMLVLLAAYGVYCAVGYLFPPDSTRLSVAETAEVSLRDEVTEAEESLAWMESFVAAPRASVELGYVGANLKRAKNSLVNAERHYTTGLHQVGKLAKSAELSVQLQAAGVAKKLAGWHDKLPALNKRLSELEPKLKDLLR